MQATASPTQRGTSAKRLVGEPNGWPMIDCAPPFLTLLPSAERARLAANLVPEAPADVILFDSIRRFKGLERPVIVLVELKPNDKRLDQLLYIGASRARQHLVVISPANVLRRLR